MKTDVTVSAKLGKYSFDDSVEIGSEEAMKETIFDAMVNENPEIEEDEDGLTADDVTFDITDYEDLAEYENLHDKLEELADYSGSYGLGVVSAAVACDVEISDIDEAYSGKFSDDEDFAEDMAEQLGEIDHNAHWPHNHIDWERAAGDLMQDYTEENGYYFRRL